MFAVLAVDDVFRLHEAWGNARLACCVVQHPGARNLHGHVFAGQTAMSATSAVLPAASCAAFVLSTRYHAASEASVEQQKEPENLRAYAQNSSAHLSFTRPLVKMTIGLALYSFAFSLYLGIAALGGNSFSKAYIVEPTSAVALAAIALLAFRFAQTTTPYALYRIVAPLFGVGFALLALHVQPLIAGLFVTLGYLTFEVLSYNDFCNIVKASRRFVVQDDRLRKARQLSRHACRVGCGIRVVPTSASSRSLRAVGSVRFARRLADGNAGLYGQGPRNDAEHCR